MPAAPRPVNCPADSNRPPDGRLTIPASGHSRSRRRPKRPKSRSGHSLHTYSSVAICSGPATAGSGRQELAVAAPSRQELARAGKNGTVPYSSVQDPLKRGGSPHNATPVRRRSPTDTTAWLLAVRCPGMLPIGYPNSLAISGPRCGANPKTRWLRCRAQREDELSTLSPRAPQMSKPSVPKTATGSRQRAACRGSYTNPISARGFGIPRSRRRAPTAPERTLPVEFAIDANENATEARRAEAGKAPGVLRRCSGWHPKRDPGGGQLARDLPTARWKTAVLPEACLQSGNTYTPCKQGGQRAERCRTLGSEGPASRGITDRSEREPTGPWMRVQQSELGYRFFFAGVVGLRFPPGDGPGLALR